MINTSGNGEYKGFKVETWEDVEPEENIKIMTDVVGPDGQRHFLDISPYCWGSERVQVIEAVIDAGFPDRSHLGIYGPFHGSDIPAIKRFGETRPGLCEDCNTNEGRYSIIICQRVCSECWQIRCKRVFGS